MVVIYKNYDVVSRSQNLRGLLRYANDKKTFVIKVVIAREEAGAGSLYLQWADGAVCRTHFSSYSVLEHFVTARRSWRGAEWIQL